jgi:acetoin utilization deacetylase AcuC-like enzyme
MKMVTEEHCVDYHRPGHPEQPARISGTWRRLKELSQIKVDWITPKPAEDAPILRAHSAKHLKRLEEGEDFDADTAFFPGIVDRARFSAGAALETLRLTLAGHSAFSLMRPPGHHATRHQSMGFCYLNNMAIACLEAVETGARRVAVFDFDVHHGNGTEAILCNKPWTCFVSVHQFPCYPGTGARNEGDNCFNFPVAPQTPRQDYRKILTRGLEKLLAFKPDLIGVSAGFDAYRGDPLAQETLEAEDFNWLGTCLRKSGVPFFSLLEGGYSDDLPDLILAYLSGVEGK